jgi:uncharacterized protein (TIGR02466 family)
MPVEGWFATPVYFDYVDNKESIQQEISNVYQTQKYDQAPGWGSSTHKVSDPTFDSNIINDLDLINFQQEVDKHVKNYVSILGGNVNKPFKISSSWLTLTNPREYTRIHNHGYSDISGVYYFKTNKADGDLVFLSPNTNLATMVFADIKDTVSYQPEEGKLILFPGWLYHTVSENDTDSDRVSLSFNIYFDR